MLECLVQDILTNQVCEAVFSLFPQIQAVKAYRWRHLRTTFPKSCRQQQVQWKNSHWERALADWLGLWALCNDIIAIQALVLDALISKEFRKPPRSCDGCALAVYIILSTNLSFAVTVS